MVSVLESIHIFLILSALVLYSFISGLPIYNNTTESLTSNTTVSVPSYNNTTASLSLNTTVLIPIYNNTTDTLTLKTKVSIPIHNTTTESLTPNTTVSMPSYNNTMDSLTLNTTVSISNTTVSIPNITVTRNRTARFYSSSADIHLGQFSNPCDANFKASKSYDDASCEDMDWRLSQLRSTIDRAKKITLDKGWADLCEDFDNELTILEPANLKEVVENHGSLSKTQIHHAVIRLHVFSDYMSKCDVDEDFENVYKETTANLKGLSCNLACRNSNFNEIETTKFAKQAMKELDELQPFADISRTVFKRYHCEVLGILDSTLETLKSCTFKQSADTWRCP